VSTVPHPLSAAAPEAASAKPADAVEVGRILGAWGVKGGLKLKPFASDPQALFSSKRWFIEPGDAASALRRPATAHVPGAIKSPTLLHVTEVREQGEHIVATAPEVSDRDVAQALAGWRVFVARSSFPQPDDGEFYWIDLIGLDVVNREGVALGSVSGLIETGPHCVLKVQPAATRAEATAAAEAPAERLIPFVDAYVDTVDLPGRLIRVDWDPSY
jgi:16S rRNA processing protein RimM